MAKHGAERHFVRPDGVYRTSVLQAIPGYQPVSNAQQVAARFTAAPYFATFHNPAATPPVSGLAGYGLGRQRRARLIRGMDGLGYYLGDDGTVTPAATSPLAPFMSLWAKLKIRWQAFLLKIKYPHAAATVAAVAASTPSPANAGLPTDAVAQLPPGGQGGYGVGPASQNMAKVGAQITAGMVQTGDDAAPPSVAVPQYTAGTQIRPDITDQPQQLSEQLLIGTPPFVADAANAAVISRFIGLRTWTWR